MNLDDVDPDVIVRGLTAIYLPDRLVTGSLSVLILGLDDPDPGDIERFELGPFGILSARWTGEGLRSRVSGPGRLLQVLDCDLG